MLRYGAHSIGRMRETVPKIARRAESSFRMALSGAVVRGVEMRSLDANVDPIEMRGNAMNMSGLEVMRRMKMLMKRGMLEMRSSSMTMRRRYETHNSCMLTSSFPTHTRSQASRMVVEICHPA